MTDTDISSMSDDELSDIYAKGISGLMAMGQLGDVSPDVAYDMMTYVDAHPGRARREIPVADIAAEYDRAYLHAVAERAMAAGYRSAIGDSDERRLAYSAATGLTPDEVSAATADGAPAAMTARFYEKLYGGVS